MTSMKIPEQPKESPSPASPSSVEYERPEKKESKRNSGRGFGFYIFVVVFILFSLYVCLIIVGPIFMLIALFFSSSGRGVYFTPLPNTPIPQFSVPSVTP